MRETESSPRLKPAALRGLAADLFERAGLDREKAEAVAFHLVAADQMGRPSHGLALAPRYLDDLRTGAMTRDGAPEIVADTGSCLTWDGRMLPGMWLTARALDAAIERAAETGSAIIAVRRSHHIGALGTYLQRATSRGLMAILASSAPGKGCVAPYGGTRALFATNPLAAGIPTSGDPILIDTSASIVANNKTRGMARRGETAPADWFLNAEGKPTNDPAAVGNGGTILPAGGLDHGHKGYSWAILVAILTQALTGAPDPGSDRGSSIFIHVIDPRAMVGLDAFVSQSERLAEACRTNPPRPGVGAVRLPGQAALRRQRESEENGIELRVETVEGLETEALKLGVALPHAL